MRIGMLLVHHRFPPDIRVEKEARLLSAAGHEVTVVVDRSPDQADREALEGMAVRRIDPPSRLMHLAYSAFRSATWRYPHWEMMLRESAREYGFEALHVHDLPAAKSALRVGRNLGIPVVLDLHENYPAAVASYGRERPFAARVIATTERYKAYERWAVNRADALVTVVEEAADRVRELVTTTAPVVAFANVDEADRVVPWRPDPDRFLISYAGGFGPHRGLESLVRAFGMIATDLPHARLLIMGTGTPSMKASLFGVVDELGLSDKIEFTGWVSEEEMRERLADSSVGVVPHLRSEHTDTTSPHKLHQYMAAGLPVVVTDCRPLARVVEESGGGLVARSGDPESLANALRRMSDHETRMSFSQAALEASRTRYSLDSVARPLLRLYEELG